MSMQMIMRRLAPEIRNIIEEGSVRSSQLADQLIAVLDEYGGAEWTEQKAMYNLGSVSLELVDGRGVFIAKALGGQRLSDDQLDRAVTTVTGRLVNTLQLDRDAFTPEFRAQNLASCVFDTRVPEDLDGIAERLLVGTSGAELHMNGVYAWRVGLLHPNADVDLDEVAEKATEQRGADRVDNAELDLDLPDADDDVEPDDGDEDDELSPLEQLAAAATSDLAVEVIPLDGSDLTEAAVAGYGDLLGLLASTPLDVLACEVDNDGGRFPAGIVYFDDVDVDPDVELPTGTLTVSGFPPVYVRPF